MGGGVLCALRPRGRRPRLQGGVGCGLCAGRLAGRGGGGGDGLRRRGAQEDQERDLLQGPLRGLSRRGFLLQAGDRRTEDRRIAARRRRGAGADAFDQSGLHRLFQGAAGADDAQCGHRLAASHGEEVFRRGGPGDGQGGRSGRRAGRPDPGGGRAQHAADRPHHEIAARRRDPGDRRHPDGAGGLFQRQSGDRRRSRQRARLRRCQRRSERRRQAHRPVQELRQFRALHQ